MIASLVQQQRDLGIKPQCDINGTLCGSPSSEAPHRRMRTGAVDARRETTDYAFR
jgi:hypothetical protein